MNLAYIGCILIATGTMIVLVEPFSSVRKLRQHQQDAAKALGVGFIGIGTILTLNSVIRDFAREHLLLAVLGLAFVFLAGVLVIAIPHFLTTREHRTDDEVHDGQEEQDDDVGDDEDLQRKPGNKQEGDHQDPSPEDEVDD